MNLLFIEGGKKAERLIAEDVVNWCLKKLLPRYRTIDITVEFKKNLDAYGYCMQEDDRVYTLTLKKGMGLFDLISTITHEMIHLKQYVKKELRDENGNTMWKKKAYNNVDYFDAPWEKEAYKLEKKLAVECFEQMQIIL